MQQRRIARLGLKGRRDFSPGISEFLSPICREKQPLTLLGGDMKTNKSRRFERWRDIYRIEARKPPTFRPATGNINSRGAEETGELQRKNGKCV